MLGILLQILSILGIILLALLALLAAVLLLVLFFPVFYRVSGEKDESGLRIRAKVKWLFGLLRVKFQYPEPGGVIVRLLWFKLYDAKIPAGDDGKSSDGKKDPGRAKTSGGEAASGKKENAAEGAAVENKDASGDRAAGQKNDSSGEEYSVSGAESGGMTGSGENETPSEEEKKESNVPGGDSASGGKISQKIAKIKYTIRNIYDKIKEIWENIKYYIELLQEEDTKQLFSHVWFRLCRILKHIRPRRLRADILFGTGSPDTTGYAYGVYCMLSSILGPGFWVTPDFERAVLRAEFEVSGHITLWVLLVNVLKVLSDKKLRQFIRKMKKSIHNEEKHS